MTQNPTSEGIVLNYQSNFYTVKVEDTNYQCFLKGLLKKEGTDVVVGDRVLVDNLNEVNAAGRITQVLERANQLSRPKIANIDRAMVVAAIQNPALDLGQLDRYITLVQLAQIEPLICISKADLAEDSALIETVKSLYENLGIPVFATSIKQPDTVEALFNTVKGQTVVLAGQSGVGKSSLLNAYQPGLQLATRELSEKVQRGQHTTRQVSLIAIDETSYIADTPGFSYLKFDQTAPADIEAVFRDFEPYRSECRFDNCLHLDEADCAIKDNLAQIAASRYDSYKAFQSEAEAYVDLLQTTSQKKESGYKTIKKGKAPDLKILKLSEKQRQSSRRTQRQQISDWASEDGTLEE
jgi:ribosome biogenesis GTPase / thiamine phosphate phosphatase